MNERNKKKYGEKSTYILRRNRTRFVCIYEIYKYITIYKYKHTLRNRLPLFRVEKINEREKRAHRYT